MSVEMQIRRAVVWHCRNHPVVTKDHLKESVGNRFRSKFPFRPYPGHAWAIFKHLVQLGSIKGMWKGQEFGVERASHLIPKTEEEPPESRQLGFGFGE